MPDFLYLYVRFKDKAMEEKEVLLQTIGALNSTISSLSETNANLQKRIDELTAQVAWLNRQLFGRKSEKLAKYDPNQLTLFDDEFLAGAAEVQQARDEAVASMTQSTQDKKQERKNRKMIEELPVLERVVIEPENIDLNLYRDSFYATITYI